MANIPGTNLAAGIVPFTSDDTYPTHYAMYGKGGHRTVQSIVNRNSIPTTLKEEGMTVFVLDDNTKYTWKKNPNNSNTVEWLSDANINAVGANTQVIFNDNGVLAGNNDFIFDKITKAIKVGNWTKFGNPLGSNNSMLAIGYNAGLNSTDSDLNSTAFGNYALSQVASSSGNTAFGFSALRLVTGSGNTAIGQLCLGNLINSSSNTAIGRYAGGASTTGSNAVLIGYESGWTETDISNKLIIESNSNKNANKDYLIEGDFSERWVKFNGAVKDRINTITPTIATITGTTTSSTTNTITDTTKTFVVNSLIGKALIITSGAGINTAFYIESNTETLIKIGGAFFGSVVNTGVTYKVLDGIGMNYNDCGTEYLFDLTNEDGVLRLPTLVDRLVGTNTSATIVTSSNNNRLYILTTSSNLLQPDATVSKTIADPYTRITFKAAKASINNTTDYWTYQICSNEQLSATKDLFSPTINLDLHTKIYKLTVSTASTIVLNINSSYTRMLLNNTLTIELHINMTAASLMTFPVNVSWVGGSTPSFNAINKYAVVLRTMDAGTTWIANLAYTY